MWRVCFSLFLLTIAAGCGPHYVDYFPYRDDGTLKPHIALVPILDSSNSNLCCNFAKELTDDVRYEIMDHGDVYLFSPEEIQEDLANCKQADLFGTNLSFAKNFKSGDFVVVAEVIEHKIIPYEKGKAHLCNAPVNPCNSILSIKLRLRILDIRECEPRIVLQEIFSRCQVVATQGGIEEKSYHNVSYCHVYKRFIKEFVDRIESVAWNVR